MSRPVKASQLKENSAQTRVILREVKAILACIYDKIRDAHDADVMNPVRVRVPINFTVVGMKNVEAQRRIYYLILQDLIQNEFNAKILMGKDGTIFEISWMSDEEKKQVDYEIEVLAQHTKHV
jgi:hypothetical protein